MMSLMSRYWFQAMVILLLLALFGAGLAAIVAGSRDSRSPIGIIVPTASPVREATVYVTGAVAHAGLHPLREGDRVADAVAAAGGFTPDADQAAINLAQRVTDEQHIHVPRIGEPLQPPVPAAPGAETLVDINAASQLELEQLPGIGPALAEAIVGYREANGRFGRVEDLLNVPRIGEATLKRLRPLITVAGGDQSP